MEDKERGRAVLGYIASDEACTGRVRNSDRFYYAGYRVRSTRFCRRLFGNAFPLLLSMSLADRGMEA